MRNGERIEYAIRCQQWIYRDENNSPTHPIDWPSATPIAYDCGWATDEVTKALCERMVPPMEHIHSEVGARSFIAHLSIYYGLGNNYFPTLDFNIYKEADGSQVIDDDMCEKLALIESEMISVIGAARATELALELIYELNNPAS